MPAATRLVVSLVMCAFATTSAAASVTWEFEGVVTFVDRGILDESVTVGTPFNGRLTFDPTVPDVLPEPYLGGYEQVAAAAEFRVQVGGYVFRSYDLYTAAPRFGFLIKNDRSGADLNTPRPGHDEISINSRDNEATGSFCCGLNGSGLTTFDWALVSGRDPLSSTALPTAPFVLEEWVNRFEIRGDNGVFGPPVFVITGTVTQVVPEAGSGQLLALGAGFTLLLALVAGKRLRKDRVRGGALLVSVVVGFLYAEVRAQGADRVVSNPAPPNEDDGITQSETALVASGSTRCIAWNDLGQNEATGLIVNGWGASADAGTTFTDRGPVPVGPTWPTDPPQNTSVPGADPVLVRRSADNPADARFLFFALDIRPPQFPYTLARGILWYETFDCSSMAYGGRVTHAVTADDGFVDKPMAVVDNTKLLPNGQPNPRYRRIYVVWSKPYWYPYSSSIWMAYSDDPPNEPGQGWANKSLIFGYAPESGRVVLGAWPAVAPNGDVYVAFADHDVASDADFSLRLFKSTDGGASWVQVEDIATEVLVPRRLPTALEDCPSDALNGWIRNPPFPQIAISANSQAPAGYVIHASYQYDPGPVGGDVADVFYRRSLTGAGSLGAPAWEAERRVNDDPTSTDQWNPAIAATDSGYVAVAWYDRRLDTGSNLFFDRHLATSQDFGTNWSANVRVTDSSSPVSRNYPEHVDWTPLRQVARCYHGDYDQVAISGSVVHLAWSDDRRVGPGCPYDPNDPDDPYQNSCPNPDVYYDEYSFDFDGDGVTDAADGCPTIAGNTGVDVDMDSVDDACDTCAKNDDFNNEQDLDLGPNPALAGPLPANRTAVSGQFDDDGDGIGNQCDFDYDNAGLVITATDFNHMKASVGKLVAQAVCGAAPDNNQSCGEFDHDGAGAVVSATDFNKAKMAIGGVIVGPPPQDTPWKKMSCGAACTPPLSPPIGGPGQPVLGKAICQGVACQ